MSTNIRSNSLAAYFGVDQAIEGFIPELLADFFDLGGFPEQIAALMRPLSLPAGKTRALDLGCGKGAVSMALARTLGFHMVGIDLMKPFVQEATDRAAEQGLLDLCQFDHGDIREVVAQMQGFDVVLLVSVGDVLGPMDQTVQKLRQTIRPGGFMVIDDGYLKPNAAGNLPGYEQCCSHGEMLDLLSASGDRVVTEHLIPLEETRTQNQTFMDWIIARVEKLKVEHPEHAAAFDRYVQKEREEVAFLENSFVSATWVLEKSRG
ncbi:MAG: class I SAM-dependent methyltransferase [Myxococcota bacterium]|nr:class I SAM-dependent methyltransferase [Myxococcota bacterium]